MPPHTDLPPEQKQLVNTIEAAKFLDLKPETLERWRPKRRGPKYVKIGANVRYKIADLDAYINQNTIETTAK